MNTEVNFELAKLLKEKGFDKPVLSIAEVVMLKLFLTN
jgi:hypothetical protein